MKKACTSDGGQSYQRHSELPSSHGLLTYALVEEGLKTTVADNEPRRRCEARANGSTSPLSACPKCRKKDEASPWPGAEHRVTEGEQRLPIRSSAVCSGRASLSSRMELIRCVSRNLKTLNLRQNAVVPIIFDVISLY